MMKRMATLLLILAVLVNGMPLALADGTDAPVYGAVRTYTNEVTRVKLYQEPFAQSTVLLELYSGVLVEILGTEEDYVHVRVGQSPVQPVEGFIPAANIERNLGELTTQTPVLTVYNTSGGTGITLRSAPSTTESVAYGVLRNDQQAVMLGMLPNHEWYLVQTAGIYAYVARYGFSGFDGSPIKNVVQPNDKDDETQEVIHAFYGPTGAYVTAEWNLKLPEDVQFAAVNNPKQAERLHLREEASYSSKSLGRYYNGVRVEVLDRGSEWTYVRIGELVGYMRTEFLDFKEPFPESGMPVMEIYNPGKLANMKLRLQPDMNAEYDGVYKNGTKITLMGFTADWAHVICDGKMGFMRTEFLK